MSLLQLRVELPTYSHSFSINVPTSGSIRDVKAEIFKTCHGAPRVEGQRVIWRGRLLRDEQLVQDIWKSPADSTIIHLSVLPTAWTSSPPNAPAPPTEPATVESTTSALSPAAAPVSNPWASGYFPAGQPPPPFLRNRFQPSPPHPAHPSPQLSPPPPPEPFATPAPQLIPHHNMPFGYGPPAPTLTFAPMYAPAPQLVSLGYITFKHQNALLALTQGRTHPTSSPQNLEAARQHAVAVLAQLGWAWPTVLDEEYPTPSNEGLGAKFIRTKIEGQDYFQHVPSSGPPTPYQLHALDVLSHSFPILFIPNPTPAVPMALPAPLPGNVNHVNDRLRALGLPPMRNPNENAVIAELRAFPIGALFGPLLMLTFRTLFLLYLFSPFDKPVFGLLVSAWFLYETWTTIRNALIRAGPLRDRGRAPQVQGGGPPGQAPLPGQVPLQAPGQGQAVAGGPAGRGAPPPPSPPPLNPHPRVDHVSVAADVLSRMNLQEENAALDAQGVGTPPSLGHKIWSFVSLLVLTAYPGLWERRRRHLRQREGRIRTEFRALEQLDEPLPGPEETEDTDRYTAQQDAVTRANEARARARAEIGAAHERRAGWVKAYVERVRETEWAED
ncbi:hypothetical protein OF83DRAFT_1081496 [Amylostereum chailletii]|nr:hypothetical protein OF83DRAFT_1081496 [Amylostereum chailletii]